MKKTSKSNTLITVLGTLLVVLIAYGAFAAYKLNQDQKALNVTPQETPTTDTTSVGYIGSGNIHIFQPKNNEKIGQPLKVLGEVRVFENQFSIRVKDAKGNILIEENATAQSGDAGQFNLFEKDIKYPKSKTTTGTLEIFDYSAKDGSEIDKVIVPIRF